MRLVELVLVELWRLQYAQSNPKKWELCVSGNSVSQYGIPLPAAMIHFSALTFPGAHKFDEFIKLMLFNLIIMADFSLSRMPRIKGFELEVLWEPCFLYNTFQTKSFQACYFSYFCLLFCFWILFNI